MLAMDMKYSICIYRLYVIVRQQNPRDTTRGLTPEGYCNACGEYGV